MKFDDLPNVGVIKIFRQMEQIKIFRQKEQDENDFMNCMEAFGPREEGEEEEGDDDDEDDDEIFNNNMEQQELKAEKAAEEEKARRKAKEDAEWTETEFPPSAYQVFVAVMCDRLDKQGTLAMMDVGLLAATVSNAWRELTPEQEDDMKNWATQIRTN